MIYRTFKVRMQKRNGARNFRASGLNPNSAIVFSFISQSSSTQPQPCNTYTLSGGQKLIHTPGAKVSIHECLGPSWLDHKWAHDPGQPMAEAVQQASQRSREARAALILLERSEMLKIKKRHISMPTLNRLTFLTPKHSWLIMPSTRPLQEL